MANTDSGSSFEHSGNGDMRSGQVTVASKPIEPGIYGWGWIEYNRSENPTEVSVMILEDVFPRRKVEDMHRFIHSSTTAQFLYTFLPIIIAIALITIQSSLAPIAGALTIVTLWRMTRTQRISRNLYKQILGNQNLERLDSGREFLRALSHKGLLTDRFYAYFNLRASADELSDTISELSEEP